MKVLQFDHNLSEARLKKIPLNETLSLEMSYINKIGADVIFIRESNREVIYTSVYGITYSTWESIYELFLPDYKCLEEKAIKGDQSKFSFGILTLVKKDIVNRIKIEIHDISAKSSRFHTELPRFSENKISLLFIDNKPVYIAWHAWLARKTDTLWVWKAEMNNIKNILNNYCGESNDNIIIVGDTNMIHPEQKEIFKKIQTEHNFKYSYGTSDNHISFYGNPHDFVLETDIPNKLCGIADEKIEDGKKYVIPICAIDGVLSNKEFTIIAPSFSNGYLEPIRIQNTEFNDDHIKIIKNGFKSIAIENERLSKSGLKKICAFDHVAFLVEI